MSDQHEEEREFLAWLKTASLEELRVRLSKTEETWEDAAIYRAISRRLDAGEK